MSYKFTISPDFSPDHLPGWYIFNTWLQKQTDIPIHLEMYDSFLSQREAIKAEEVDLIYANPYDAAMLVREQGFRPLVKPIGIADETIIAVSAENSASDISELAKGLKLAITDAPDVQMMGMIMLEPANLEAEDVQNIQCDTYVLVAKKLLKGEADVGFFLAEAYDDLSDLIKSKLRLLVRSQISVIHHSLMAGPKLLDKRSQLLDCLTQMPSNPKGKGVLESLGFTGWAIVDDDEMEFMIDLIDTLLI